MPKLFLRKNTPAPAPSIFGGKRLVIGGGKAAPVAPPAPVVHPLCGKFVTFDMDGTTVVGLVSKQISADNFSVRMCLPDKKGLVIVTDSEIIHPAAGLEAVNAAKSREAKAKAWNEICPWQIDKKMVEIRDGSDAKTIVDYRDVFIEGFASTFKNVTPSDLDGDYVAEDAFDETIADFMQNPVMLYDHRNSVNNIAGSFSKVGIIKGTGLAVRAEVSNSPDIRHIRFLIVEGHLKAFSIGGFFLYGEDGREIQFVKLLETSLVAIPANPDALFQMRSIGNPEMKSLWTRDGAQKQLRTWVS